MHLKINKLQANNKCSSRMRLQIMNKTKKWQVRRRIKLIAATKIRIHLKIILKIKNQRKVNKVDQSKINTESQRMLIRKANHKFKQGSILTKKSYKRFKNNRYN